MIRSRRAEAFGALLRASARIAAFPVDAVMSLGERRVFNPPVRLDSWPLVLVVGGPRSGTTVITQVLASHMDVSPTTNIVEVFPRSPLTMSRLFGLKGRSSSDGSYRSYYGSTRGLHEPSDAFEIWDRWLGSDRYRATDEISDLQAEEMRRFFSVWTQLAGRPLLNKNNRNTGVMGMLAQALPAARFIVVRRDPLYVAQSLLVARQEVQGDRTAGWGFGAGDDNEDPIEAVSNQVKLVESTITREELKVDASRRIMVSYEDFCSDPGSAVSEIGRRFGINYELEGLEPLRNANRRTLDPIELDRLAALLKPHEP